MTSVAEALIGLAFADTTGFRGAVAIDSQPLLRNRKRGSPNQSFARVTQSNDDGSVRRNHMVSIFQSPSGPSDMLRPFRSRFRG